MKQNLIEYEPIDDSHADADYVLSEQESNVQEEQDKIDIIRERTREKKRQKKYRQLEGIKPSCRPCRKKINKRKYLEFTGINQKIRI